ncbi:MAG TPA: hypothetical protein VHH35_16335 [Pyrinomonadaceae bacterium]|nr:hypothetical protein [Pyrinomonadaceae bacterium]
MLTRVCAVLFLLSLFAATPSIVSAQAGSAIGTFKFIMDEESTIKTLDFEARTDSKGNTAGVMRFSDEMKVTFQDVDGTGEPQDEPGSFFMTAALDAMTIQKNTAVISGVVRESSHRSYVGKWIQLVIEDNDGIRVADKFGWSFCQPDLGGWIPSDFEVPGDKGAFMSWWATDAERKDDVGIPSPNLIPGSLKACKVFPVRAYDWATILKADGEIRIAQEGELR